MEKSSSYKSGVFVVDEREDNDKLEAVTIPNFVSFPGCGGWGFWSPPNLAPQILSYSSHCDWLGYQMRLGMVMQLIFPKPMLFDFMSALNSLGAVSFIDGIAIWK